MEGIVLGRVGHYFDATTGGCSTALVVFVFDGGELINVAGWHRGGEPFSRTSVPVFAEKTEPSANSFHLTRDCPWSR